MSYVFNMVGGGGGSLKDTDAILTVNVPTGSTVTMTKGGVTLTPTMWVQAADPTLDCALFVISPSLFDAVNAWTVTATLGTNTASDTVTISTNKQYDISVFPPVSLFKSGEGQIIPLSSGNQRNASISIDTNAITVNYSANVDFQVYCCNATAIDITEYSSLVVVAQIISYHVGNQENWGYVVAADSMPTPTDSANNSKYKAKVLISSGSSELTTTLDISSLTLTSAFVGVFGGSMRGTIREMYLQR